MRSPTAMVTGRQHHRQAPSTRFRALCVVIVGVVVCLSGVVTGVSTAAAQGTQFEEVQLPSSIEEQREVTRMSRGGTVTNSAVFRKVYLARLAELTQKSQFGNAPNIRKALRRDLETSGRLGTLQFHDELNNLVLTTCQALAGQDKYHPAARMNCVLIIGDLNDREAPLGSFDEVPMQAAQPVLLQFVTDSTTPDSVRVAALVGLLRHAQFKVLTGANRDATIAALQQLFSTARPQQRTEEVHDWILTRAGEVLSSLNAEIPPRATAAAPTEPAPANGGNGPPAAPPAG